MNLDLEKRTVPISLEAREEGGKWSSIRGTAAVFGRLSQDLGGFREQIAPGAFLASLESDDIRGLWNHNDDLVLGRTKAGTLRLWEDEEGLQFEIMPPPTTWARDAMVTLARGDVDQMSFQFAVPKDGDSWHLDEAGQHVRTLHSVRLFEVSPVAFPAYPQTTAAVRSRVEGKGHETRSPGSCPNCTKIIPALGRIEARLGLIF